MEQFAKKTLSNKPSSLSCDVAKQTFNFARSKTDSVAGDIAQAVWGGALIHLQHWLGEGDSFLHYCLPERRQKEQISSVLATILGGKVLQKHKNHINPGKQD